MHLIKWAGASAPTPSAGLTSRQKPYALSLRRQVPGVPRCKNLHATPSRGKRLRGTPASPSTSTEEGGRNLFHRLEVECPWSGMLTGSTLTRVFLVRRTLLTMPVASPKLLTLPFPTGGKDQVGNRLEKGVVQQRSFKAPSRSSAAEPLG